MSFHGAAVARKVSWQDRNSSKSSGVAIARGVEEVLVLADPPRARLRALPLGGDAVDGDLGLVRRDRSEVTDLGAELVHQVDVRVEAEVAAALDHELALGLAELLLQL